MYTASSWRVSASSEGSGTPWLWTLGPRLPRLEGDRADRSEQVVLDSPVGVVRTDLAEHLPLIGGECDRGHAGDAFVVVPETAWPDGAVSVRIREEREGEPELLRHRGVGADRIDRDSDDLGAGRPELPVAARQLHELAVAVRSPVAPVEDEDDGPELELLPQAERVAVLVVECEVRHQRA